MGSVRCIKGAELIPFYALKWSKIIFLINYSSPDISSVSFQETIYSGANMIALISIPLYHASTCQNQKKDSRVWLIRLSYELRMVIGGQLLSADFNIFSQ